MDDEEPNDHWPALPLIERGMPAYFERIEEARKRDKRGAGILRLSPLQGAADLALRIAPTFKQPFRERTLASACYMRFVRMHFHYCVGQIFLPYDDTDIRMVTLIPEWSARVGELASFPLDEKMDSFAMQLRRAGVLAEPGPLVAAVHGEYDATFKVFRLHVHVLTVAAKAAVIRSRLGKHPAYQSDAFRDDPIHIKEVDHRRRDGLITYLTKPYIPMCNSYQPTKPNVSSPATQGTRWKRARDQPLKRDQLAEVLLWLDSLRLGRLLYASGTNLPDDLRRL